MTTLRTTIRIDHEEGDPRVKSIVNSVKSSKLTTSHQKGVMVVRAMNGGKRG